MRGRGYHLTILLEGQAALSRALCSASGGCWGIGGSLPCFASTIIDLGSHFTSPSLRFLIHSTGIRTEGRRISNETISKGACPPVMSVPCCFPFGSRCFKKEAVCHVAFTHQRSPRASSTVGHQYKLQLTNLDRAAGQAGEPGNPHFLSEGRAVGVGSEGCSPWREAGPGWTGRSFQGGHR